MKTKLFSILNVLVLSICITGILTACRDASPTFSALAASNQQESEKRKSDALSEQQEANFDSSTFVPLFNYDTKTVRLNSGYDMPIAGLGTYALSDE